MKKGSPKVSPDALLAIAGCLWAAAGVNILVIGVSASHGVWALWTVGLAILVFLAFHIDVFTRLVRKHSARIRAYGSKVPFYRFFDKKSYLIMAIMMTTGIAIRVSGVVPEVGIAFFYTGLGLALVFAGIGFLGRFMATMLRRA